MTALLLSPLFRAIAGAGVLAVAFFAWLLVHDERIETRAAERTVTKIEKANDNATKLGGGAAAGSLDKRVRGKRDPTTRDD